MSVVIPCFNQAAYVGQAIESVLSQDGCEVDVIVVNDGSTDEIESALQPFQTRVHAIHQANAGVSAARNAGLAVAQHDWVVFLDADDVLREGALSRILEEAERFSEATVLYGSAVLVDCDGRPLDEVIPGDLEDDPLAKLLSANRISTPGAVMLSRRLCEAVGGFDPEVAPAEDWDFWIRLAAAGGQFKRVDCFAVGYRQHATSNSRQYSRLLDAVRRVSDKHRDLARRSWRLWFAWFCGTRTMPYFCWSRILFSQITDAWNSGKKLEAINLVRQATFHDWPSFRFVVFELIPLSLAAKCRPTVNVRRPLREMHIP